MRIEKVVPDSPGAASGTLVYRCGLCGTETKRRHKSAVSLEPREPEKLRER